MNLCGRSNLESQGKQVPPFRKSVRCANVLAPVGMTGLCSGQDLRFRFDRVLPCAYERPTS